MTTHEFHIQPNGPVGGDRPLGLVRIELDSDAEQMLDQAMDVYAGRGQATIPAMLLLLALRDLPIVIAHERRQS